MGGPLYNTLRLPKELRDELGFKDDANSTNPKRGNRSFHSRKDRRKAERSQKKQPQRRRPTPTNRRVEDDGSDESNGDLESGFEEEDDVPTARKPSSPPAKEIKSILKKRKRVEEASGEELEEEDSVPRRHISRAVREKLQDDDAEIAALEKALGIKGKKGLPKSFKDDGLDELLGDLGDGSDTEDKKRKREGDEWLRNKRMKALKQSELDEEESDESDLGEFDGEDSEEDEDMEDDGLDGLLEESDDESQEDENGFEGFEDEDKPVPEKKTRENPYVAPVAATDTDRPKYIPPSLRGAPSNDSERLIRLRRQTQGHLNKLSEANLISILGDIEKLYQDYPRRDVTSTLLDLLLSLVSDRSVLNDTFIILHAAFIAAIYKVIGMDFGAELIQNIVERFDGLYEETGAHSSEGKTLNNLVSLLSHLYNFHVIGSTLVFDYIRLFLKEINETNTELLLRVIKNSGSQLRQDDPSSLKDIVILIQPAIAQVGEDALSVRTKFMIDMITDLKNNRLKSGFAGTAISSEHLTRLRKVLGSLNTRNLRASEPLRIGRMDIHNSSKKGKWWLVGASWKDDSITTNDAIAELNFSGNSAAIIPDNLDGDFGDQQVDLAQLARAHRMNTDVRRSIFIAIMSASDCRDAHARLTKLRLKRNQEVEIPHVLIHCASEEETHNPYYTLIARKLCSERKMKMAFMFSLWDVFKRMGERGSLDEDDDDTNAYDEDDSLGTRSIVNLAKMFGHLIADRTLSLGILKTLDFAYLKEKTKTFVELLLITVMIQTQRKSPHRQKKKDDAKGDEEFDEKALVDVFLKSRETPQVVAGLTYFIRKVVAKSDVMSSKKEKRLVKWASTVAVDALGVVSEKSNKRAEF